MNSVLESAINSVQKSKTAFCKFISANDAGKTGGHQEGFYIPKNSIPLMFDTPGVKGENKDRFVTIKWQNDFETSSRFIYYGQGTRNEYRLTRFGRGFPFLTDDNVGDLFILAHIERDYYEGFVLQTDEDIEDFFSAFNLSSGETNCLINKTNTVSSEDRLLECFIGYMRTIREEFPPSKDLASYSRDCWNCSYGISDDIIRNKPDESLLQWIDAEFQLFKLFENDRYQERIKSPFESVEQLVSCANTILNRRKSRAGKSLEHHLSAVFDRYKIQYESQIVTEDNKRPDFIFPGSDCYHDTGFNSDHLVFLASKTTCKDRWRQILNEADRIKVKHLFTLQQGISLNQLNEMYRYDVRLVVPGPYIKSFPVEFQDKIFTLAGFTQQVLAMK